MTRALKPITVNVDELLAENKYNVDEDNAHIVLIDDIQELSGEEYAKLVRICPAALYKEDMEGIRRFDYAGCLECGSCRISCGSTIVKKWDNPTPTMGVVYRYG